MIFLSFGGENRPDQCVTLLVDEHEFALHVTEPSRDLGQSVPVGVPHEHAELSSQVVQCRSDLGEMLAGTLADLLAGAHGRSFAASCARAIIDLRSSNRRSASASASSSIVRSAASRPRSMIDGSKLGPTMISSASQS